MLYYFGVVIKIKKKDVQKYRGYNNVSNGNIFILIKSIFMKFMQMCF